MLLSFHQESNDDAPFRPPHAFWCDQKPLPIWTQIKSIQMCKQHRPTAFLSMSKFPTVQKAFGVQTPEYWLKTVSLGPGIGGPQTGSPSSALLSPFLVGRVPLK